jgi:rhodanese-related sulfurtransferase
MTLFLRNFTSVALILSSGALCSFQASAGEKFHTVKSAEVAKWMASPEQKLAILDANNEKTRKTDGIIPGARLLSSSKNYKIEELQATKDTKLVFYCANTQCTASHAAAKRAVDEGYQDVNVLTDGIQGWAKSGQKVQKLN